MILIRAVLALSCVAASFGAESSAERGKRVVDEAVRALGGERFLNMKDRIEAGRAYSFYRDRLSGLSHARIYTRYLIRPEPPVAGFFGVRERQVFGKNEDAHVLLTETGGYDVTFRGARPLPDEQLERYRESTLRNIFYILRMRLGEPGLTMESRGADVVDNQPVEVVDIFDADNRQVTAWFHASTKLPARQETTRRNPVTRLPSTELTLFAKYRDVGGGVMWPFQIQRERDGEKLFEIFSESVVINQNLLDNLFTIDAKTKVLTKAAPKK